MEVESDQLVIGQTSLKSDWYRIGGGCLDQSKSEEKKKNNCQFVIGS